MISETNQIDISFLNEIEPYRGDYSVKIDKIDIQKEIVEIEEEMKKISLVTIPWDLGDYITVFVAGILGGLIDIFLGKPGGYREPKIKDESYFGLGKKLKEFDVKNNPIDMQIPGSSSGDHRLYSYGHDLFRFSKSLQLIMKGTGAVGIDGVGGELSLGQIPSGYSPPDTLWKAALILLLHLYKDFWTARSLPIPGSTIIANLNNNEMPKILDDLTNKHEVNLRQLSGQVLSVSIIEITNRVWLYFKYRKSDVDKDALNFKRNKMLLVSQSVGLAFNLGKVYMTGNPFFLNIPQILRIIKLSISVLKGTADLNHKAIVKDNLSVLRTKYQFLDTLIFLDKSIYYTQKIDRIINDYSQKFYKKYDENLQNLNGHINTLQDKISEFKNIDEQI